MIKASEVISSVKFKLQSTPVDATSFVLVAGTAIVSKVRKTIGDSVEPYRWDDGTLSAFLTDGVNSIRKKRTDANYAYDGSVLAAGAIRDDFAPALYFYTLARAYDNDAGLSENNLALSQTNDKQFQNEVLSVLYFYPETILQDAINNGIQAITQDRPDVLLGDTGLMRDPEIMKIIDDKIDLPSSFKNALINYCMYEALLFKGDEKTAALHMSIFKKEISG